nr:MAG TPA_asm: hypothetical protein [Caudoviricetes sp.]
MSETLLPLYSIEYRYYSTRFLTQRKLLMLSHESRAYHNLFRDPSHYLDY